MKEPFIPDVTKWKYRQTYKQSRTFPLFRRDKYEEPMLDGIAPFNFHTRFVFKYRDPHEMVLDRDARGLVYGHCIIVYNDAQKYNPRKRGTVYVGYQWEGKFWTPRPGLGIIARHSKMHLDELQGEHIMKLIEEWKPCPGEIISYAQYKQEWANEPRRS
jgi:hypothetical protein